MLTKKTLNKYQQNYREKHKYNIGDIIICEPSFGRGYCIADDMYHYYAQIIGLTYGGLRTIRDSTKITPIDILERLTMNPSYEVMYFSCTEYITNENVFPDGKTMIDIIWQSDIVEVLS